VPRHAPAHPANERGHSIQRVPNDEVVETDPSRRSRDRASSPDTGGQVRRIVPSSGQALLDLLKGGGREGLVYWLEFKDDDEFPARFGSIAGGSARKYGVYRRRETGTWTTGSPLAQREISTKDGLAIAAAQRDPTGRRLGTVERLPAESDDDAYETLQKRIAEVAPDVQDSILGGHMYLALIYPAKLDDFHAETYQRHNLIKTVETPVAIAYARRLAFGERHDGSSERANALRVKPYF
jgi:hypothetical protein